jgi:uncharacterized membrane protein YkoI
MRTTIAVWTTLMTLGLVVHAQDTEKKIAMRDLPPAVQEAVKQQTKTATLRGLTTEVEEGRTVYEAEFKVGGRTKDITYDSAANILSTEEEIDLAKIPAPARAAIRKAAAGGTLVLVEDVTEGTARFYEAHIKRGGKETEFKVDAAGKTVQ